ncbi:MAG: methyltransferase [Actinomycetota bacterium]|nr:methyltransferase [Actinomycetota bacterium]
MTSGERPSHYFDPTPTGASAPATVELALPDLRLTLTTDRGVFSTDHVDVGTKFLLLDGPAIPPGVRTIVDVGCGYGPIALALASRCPDATVWAVDVNERALGLCEANAAAAGLANVRVATPDDVPNDLVVDRIWSNPPIRVGKAALHGLLATWLDRLAPDGSAALIVQKHLGADSLARWLATRGHEVRRLGSRRGYRILEVDACAS